MDLIKAIHSLNNTTSSLFNSIGYSDEELNKAFDRGNLIQRVVQVKGKNGTTYSRNQWVRASDIEEGDQKPSVVTAPAQSVTQPQVKIDTPTNPTPRKKATGIPKGFDIGGFKQSIESKKQEYLRVKEEALKDPSKENDRKKVGRELVKLQKQADKMGLPDDVISVYNKGSDKPVSDSKTGESISNKAESNTKESKPEKLVVSKDSKLKTKETPTTTQKAPSVPKKSTPKFDFAEDFKKNSELSSKDYVNKLKDEHGKEKVIQMAKDAGITWKHNDHEGVNWMRASMAIKHHIESGGTETEIPKVEHEKTARQQRDEVNRGTINDLVHKHGREGVIKLAKDSGVTWTEDSENEGINWMRASMAINKHLKNGGTLGDIKGTPVEPPKRVYKEKPIKYGSDPHKNKVLKLRETMSKEEIINKAKKAGVTWNEHDNEGVNWMRASMALANHFKNGGTLDSPKKSNSSAKKKESSPTSTSVNSSNDADKNIGKEFKVANKVLKIEGSNSYGKYIVSIGGKKKEVAYRELNAFLKKHKAIAIDATGELTGQSFTAGHQKYEIGKKLSDGRYQVNIKDANGKLVDTQPFNKKALKMLINKTEELNNDTEITRKIDPKESVSKIKGDEKADNDKKEESINSKLEDIFSGTPKSAKESKKEVAVDSEPHLQADNQKLVSKMQAEFESFPENPSKKYVSDKVNSAMKNSGSGIKSVLDGCTSEFDKHYKGIMRQVPFEGKDNRTVKCEKVSDSVVKFTVNNGKKSASLAWDFASNKPSNEGLSHVITTDKQSNAEVSSATSAVDYNNTHWKALLNKGTPEFNKMYKFLVNSTIDKDNTNSDTCKVKVTKGTDNTVTFAIKGTKSNAKFTWDFNTNTRVKSQSKNK